MYRLFIIFFFFISSELISQDKIPGLKQLDLELARKEIYIQKKHSDIRALETQLQKHTVNRDYHKLYYDYLSLFKAYKTFKYDSAYFYLEKAKEMASALENPELQNSIKIQEGFILLSSGLFKEAIDTLNNIDTSKLGEKD